MIYIIYCVSSNKCRMSNKCSRLISTTPLSIHIEMIASLSLSLSLPTYANSPLKAILSGVTSKSNCVEVTRDTEST